MIGKSKTEFDMNLNRFIEKFAKDDSTIIQCDECSNHVVAGEFTEQELIDDGWKLDGPIYCPVCGPDEEGE